MASLRPSFLKIAKPAVAAVERSSALWVCCATPVMSSRSGAFSVRYLSVLPWYSMVATVPLA